MKVIKYIIANWKTISAIIGILTAIYGAIKGFELGVKIRTERERIEMYRWQKVDQLIENDSLRFAQWNELINSNNILYGKVDQLIVTQKNLKSYLVDKAATKDDVKKIYEVFDAEKKNLNGIR